MNLYTKILILVLLPLFCFSQKKKDVYFILSTKSNEYTISYDAYEERKAYTIYLRDEKTYLKYLQKKKEMIKAGTYEEWDMGDNVDVGIMTKCFGIKKRKKVTLTDWDTYELNRVNYKWLMENAWKPMCNTCPYDFKNIYFLYPISKDTYISYRVYETVEEY
ncbi:MAG: hypothetical protein KGV44_10400 [Flavobacteriaceae bacterium]|nr:hypothetical protein [Flavobacteriaceae bacterium]